MVRFVMSGWDEALVEERTATTNADAEQAAGETVSLAYPDKFYLN